MEFIQHLSEKTKHVCIYSTFCVKCKLIILKRQQEEKVMKLKITNSIQNKILARDFVSFMFYMLLNK